MYIESELRQSDRVIRCRPVASVDLQPLCSLMAEVGASFAGLSSRSMHSAIGADAVENSRVTMVVADIDGLLVGFATAVVDPAAYWKSFLWHHPVIGASAVVGRFLKGGIRARLLKGRTSTETKPSTGTNHWSQSSPALARMLYVGVAEPFRGKGVAVQLYRTMFHLLASSGVQWVEAHMDHNNLPSVRLHSQFGGQFRAINENTGLLWTFNLNFVRVEKDRP